MERQHKRQRTSDMSLIDDPMERQSKRQRTCDMSVGDDSFKITKYRNRSQDWKHKWSVFKAQAKKRHIEQKLELHQYLTLIQLPCTYCGKGVGHDARTPEYVGIDRIDSDKREYCLSNCVPCCSACNFMKGATRHHQFLNQVRAIAKWRTGVEF